MVEGEVSLRRKNEMGSKGFVEGLNDLKVSRDKFICNSCKKSTVSGKFESRKDSCLMILCSQ